MEGAERFATRARRSATDVAALLFLALFAAQAGVIAFTPVLSGAAADLGVSTATAGQLRTISGLAAGLTALAVPRLSRRRSLRTVMLAGLLVLAAASLVGAAAPTFAVLALAQIAVGAAVAAIVAAASAAAAAWSPETRRTRVLSTALTGQPAAWVVGMPLIGVLGGLSWRYGLAVPLVASALAAAVVLRRRDHARRSCEDARLREAAGDSRLRRWAIAELLANSAWAGTLVYVGALFTDSYGTPPGRTGLLLAAGAAAHIAGNRSARRLVRVVEPRHLAGLALLLAVTVSLLGGVRANAATTAILFAVAAFAAGGRTLAANTYGLAVAPERRLAAMSLRASSMQFGYFAGSLVAGTALALGGYSAFGASLAALFTASALALARTPTRRRPLVTAQAAPER